MFQATASSPYHRSVQDLAAYTSPAAASRWEENISILKNISKYFVCRLQSQYSSLFLNNPAATSRLQAAAATVKSELPWPTSGPGRKIFQHSKIFRHLILIFLQARLTTTALETSATTLIGTILLILTPTWHLQVITTYTAMIIMIIFDYWNDY